MFDGRGVMRERPWALGRHVCDWETEGYLLVLAGGLRAVLVESKGNLGARETWGDVFGPAALVALRSLGCAKSV